jgi:hypothetical protein
LAELLEEVDHGAGVFGVFDEDSFVGSEEDGSGVGVIGINWGGVLGGRTSELFWFASTNGYIGTGCLSFGLRIFRLGSIEGSVGGADTN